MSMLLVHSPLCGKTEKNSGSLIKTFIACGVSWKTLS
jgi:hypothetical protein